MILGKYALVIVAITVAAWILGGLLRQRRR
jgi:hypothetical protein